MSALNNSALIGASGSTGYQISRSVRLRSSASAYFNRTPASAGNRKTWTWSGWVKRGDISTAENPLFTGYTDANNRWYARFEQNTLRFYWNVAATSNEVYTNAVFRDPSAWYHVVVAVDTTQATDSNRIKVYVNGVQQTLSGTYIPQNTDTQWNNNVVQTIGKKDTAGTYFDGYMTEVNSIDGQALTPSSFGETNPVTGVWQPKKYAGTYGTNGFYLNFSDNSGVTATTIGKDYSGNGNNWTPNNISVTAGSTYDSMLDVPTQWADGGNGRGNYCVMNPLDKNASGTMAEGNLKWTAGAAQVCTRSTFAIPASGKFYMECLVGTASSPTVGISFGLAASTVALDTSSGATNLYQLYASTNRQINLNNSTTGSLSGGFSANDILQIAVDVDNQKMWLGVNNTWYNSAFTGNGDPVAGTNATSTASMVGFFPFSNCYQNSAYWNFGQRPFAYTPPSGFKALNTLNLPTPTILKGNLYFDAVTYSGNSTYPRTIGGLNFQPDLVWQKARSVTYDHIVYDSVRGTGTSKSLSTNITSAEGFNSTFANLTAFASDGFTVDTTSSTNVLNNAGQTYVAWQWKEGATQGFDIVTYTGNGANRTIAHSLGVAPKMIIVKGRSLVSNWNVFHQSVFDVNAAYTLQLNSTTYPSGGGSPTIFNSTAPTSSVFSIGTSSDVNANGSTFVAYLFAEVAGFSKFNSYTGNGSANGPFVFCGFRPRWIMAKCSSAATSDWVIYDTSRPTYNQSRQPLYADLSAVEPTAGLAIDLLSNGFKWREAGGQGNDSGQTYIFAAFAENPFKYALAR